MIVGVRAAARRFCVRHPRDVVTRVDRLAAAESRPRRLAADVQPAEQLLVLAEAVRLRDGLAARVVAGAPEARPSPPRRAAGSARARRPRRRPPAPTAAPCSCGSWRRRRSAAARAAASTKTPLWPSALLMARPRRSRSAPRSSMSRQGRSDEWSATRPAAETSGQQLGVGGRGIRHLRPRAARADGLERRGHAPFPGVNSRAIEFMQ